MVDKQVLRLIGRTTHERLSRLLGNMCNAQNGNGSKWSNEQRDMVAAMAIFFSSAGYPTGLTAYMILNLKRGEPEAVHSLYSRYLETLEFKDTWQEQHDPSILFPNSPYVDLSQPKEPQVDQYEDEVLEQEQDAESRSNLPIVFPHIILCSIAAHALQEDFVGAITTILRTGTRISRAQIISVATQLPKSLGRSTIEYAHRLNTARLVARPGSLKMYLTDLANDRADKTITALYQSIVTELTRRNPWLTVNPAKLNDRTPILLPGETWGRFLKCFLMCRQLPMAGQVWDDLNRFGVVPTVATWISLLEGYGHLRLGDQLLTAWKLMRGEGIEPDAIAYLAIIDGLTRAKLPNEALAYFLEFRKGLKPAQFKDSITRHVHNTMVTGLLLNDALQKANIILDLMRRDQPAPDIVTYNMFMQHHARKGELKELASVLEAVDKAKLRGDAVTFSLLLGALLKVREDAQQIVFDLMRKQGIKPDVVIYTDIIHHLMLQRTPRSFTAALEVLREIEQDTSGDVAPNVITYTAVLSGILRATWMEAGTLEEWRQDITRRISERGIRLTTTTYHRLIGVALENPEWQGVQLAMLYYREMLMKDKVQRDTWYVLLHALMRREQWTLADEVLVDMKKAGFVPQHSLERLVASIRARRAYRGRSHYTEDDI
ncbi:hypothetical protein EUX98_g644 [Antrodiella citrinella]|uniref:Pentacotripeptide-repeat region of PRORP domain-containing protein n=1 Tax=Antrodiella citrinella TaxID=2447956 RepID=A0A4S4N3E4_9APHY|nr:hypothetical protein EUX98_g644 [Antrodiella citrinella]